MKILSNILHFDDGVAVPFKKSPNHGGEMTPSYLIIHYDASDTAEGAISWMVSPQSKVSAHLHISREGKIVQMVSFNVVAWHAGKSEWKGIVGMNSHSIGIELQNTGTQQYTEKQLAVLTEVAKALVSTYDLKEILGHSDIAPGRKTDPGKQFPMLGFREDVYGSSVNHKQAIVTASSLNIREGNGTNFKAIAQLLKGTVVDIIEHVGEWSEVRVPSQNLKGWVSSKYLH